MTREQNVSILSISSCEGWENAGERHIQGAEQALPVIYGSEVSIG